MRTTWEYKSIEVLASGFLVNQIDREKLDAILDEVGVDGWELVTAFATNQFDGQTRNVIAIFKRPR